VETVGKGIVARNANLKIGENTNQIVTEEKNTMTVFIDLRVAISLR